MKILIAPDSFKGSLDSISVCRYIDAGIKSVLPNAETIHVPIADGGEGTVAALVHAMGGQCHTIPVTGPLGGSVNATFAVLSNGTGVVEMAAASGLPLVPPDKRNPMLTTTYGTGQLIKALLELGCRKMIVGIGGSATNDGGLGMAQALGFSFRDSKARELGFGGGALQNLATICTSGVDTRLAGCDIQVACDVDNPLLGPEGASAVFGPQKGATPQQVQALDGALAKLAQVANRQLHAHYESTPGAGAAGGLGYGMLAFCGASMRSGIDIVMDAVDIDHLMDGCCLVITGEGQIDGQSARGKVPVGIARRAKSHGLPVLALAGGLGLGAEAVHTQGIDAMFSIATHPMTLEDAMANGGAYLQAVAGQAMRAILLGTSFSKPK